MNKKNVLKMCVDSLMAVFLPLLMAYGLIGEELHEWIGITMVVLFIVHHVLNRHWWSRLKTRSGNAVRIVNTMVDFLLCIDMLLLGFSGIAISRYLFSSIPSLGGLELARTCHMLASYWGFALMSVHLGLHWNTIHGRLKAVIPAGNAGRVGKRIAHIITIIISAYGIYAFHRRQVGIYMLHKSHFVFFDYSEPLIYFLFDYLSIMILFAVAACYISRLIQKCSKKY